LSELGRLRLARFRVEAGASEAQAAERFQVSVTTAARWASRYRQQGAAAMVDRSSRPHRCPHQTRRRLVKKVVHLRTKRGWGPARIGPRVGLPASTVHKILRRQGLPRLVDVDLATRGELRRRGHRYEHEHPGDLVHVDIKKLGRIPDGGGWKAHGRSMGSTAAKKKARTGYDYVHSMVDDHSRLAYSEILTDEKGPTCAGFILRAAEHFAGHGITIERVITDNHFSYRRSTDVKAAMTVLGATPKFIKPHCPWQNGKVERFNRTLATEWAYRQVFDSNAERAAALAPWLNEYNTQRRHSALGGLPPISRLSPT